VSTLHRANIDILRGDVGVGALPLWQSPFISGQDFGEDFVIATF